MGRRTAYRKLCRLTGPAARDIQEWVWALVRHMDRQFQLVRHRHRSAIDQFLIAVETEEWEQVDDKFDRGPGHRSHRWEENNLFVSHGINKSSSWLSSAQNNFSIDREAVCCHLVLNLPGLLGIWQLLQRCFLDWQPEKSVVICSLTAALHGFFSLGVYISILPSF